MSKAITFIRDDGHGYTSTKTVTNLDIVKLLDDSEEWSRVVEAPKENKGGGDDSHLGKKREDEPLKKKGKSRKKGK